MSNLLVQINLACCQVFCQAALFAMPCVTMLFDTLMMVSPMQMSVELIPYEELKWGRFLGRGAEGAVYAAWYLETPVAVKRPESKVEVEMNLHSGLSLQCSCSCCRQMTTP